ncbi:serine hydroxymethyltransferase, partial [Planctomycetota bacterium]
MLDLPEKISSQEYHDSVFLALKEQDVQIYDLITREYERLQNSLQLIAAENQCSRAVLAALGSVVQNKTTEGFPGTRFHGGCEFVDDIEN